VFHTIQQKTRTMSFSKRRGLLVDSR